MRSASCIIAGIRGKPSLVALHAHECVGRSYSAVNREHSLVDIDMTGVHRDFRKQGIATALKVRGVVDIRGFAMSAVYNRV